jgi:hypothetical protein
MANLSGFDADTIPEQQEFSALPEGQYVAIATASEMKVTKSGTGKFLQVVFEVLEGARKGAKVWARMNLENPNQIAVDIGQRELASICRAVGVPKPKDSAELHNKPLLITVAVEIDDRKREGNVIKKYESVGQQKPIYAGSAPSMNASAAQAPSAAPASSTPPWAK